MVEYPTLRLTQEEFKALPEYSATFPTGTTIGKRWRRLNGVHDEDFIRCGGKPRWYILEYVEIGKKDRVGIKWYKPVIVVKAPQRRLIIGSLWGDWLPALMLNHEEAIRQRKKDIAQIIIAYVKCGSVLGPTGESAWEAAVEIIDYFRIEQSGRYG